MRKVNCMNLEKNKGKKNKMGRIHFERMVVVVVFGFVFLRIVKEGLTEKVTSEKMLAEYERVSFGDSLRKCILVPEVGQCLDSRKGRRAFPSGGSE